MGKAPEPACPLGRASLAGGRYWVRTSDLFRVREARYHCANRPFRPRPDRPPVDSPLGGAEVETGFEPVYTALQAVASPLGHSTARRAPVSRPAPGSSERTTGF